MQRMRAGNAQDLQRMRCGFLGPAIFIFNPCNREGQAEACRREDFERLAKGKMVALAQRSNAVRPAKHFRDKGARGVILPVVCVGELSSPK